MKRLRVLILEDMATDAELITAELIAGGMDVTVRRVDTEESFLEALASFRPEVILADYNIPGFDGVTALALRNQKASSTPFIFVTGSLGEERAVDTLRAGATDYILKDRMTRLCTAVTRALEESRHKEEKNRIAADLEAERRLVKAIQETAKAVIIVLDSQGHILHVNNEGAQILGQPRLSLMGGIFWKACIAAEDIKNCREQLLTILKQSASGQHVWRAATRNGRRIMWSAANLATGAWQNSRIVLCGIDMTDQEEAEERAYILDNFDLVTGLPNRKLFQQQVVQYCNESSSHEGVIAAMMVGFKRVQEIRDSYDESVINEILVAMVQRLRSWPVKRQLVARVSDHAYSLIFEAESETELATHIPQLLDLLQQPVEYEERHFVLPAYAGVAIYNRDASDAVALVQAAETALHRAEADEGTGFAFYSSGLSDAARARLQLESELRTALKHDRELLLYYQPQINVKTRKVIGLEALIRWFHPRNNLMFPDTFIPIAEDYGLMEELGQWVLHAACRQIRAWQDAGITPPPVGINLSASQFSSPHLIEDIKNALQKFDLAPERLEVELTESTSMRDPQASIGIMMQLRKMGIRLSIDDFGTGYSNLSYLKRFPVHRLKLDKAFVRDIMENADDLAISHAVIAMAHQLRLEVIAEGVETTGQLGLLAAAKCDSVQGYLFSIPVPAHACQEILQKTFEDDTVEPARRSAG